MLKCFGDLYEGEPATSKIINGSYARSHLPLSLEHLISFCPFIAAYCSFHPTTLLRRRYGAHHRMAGFCGTTRISPTSLFVSFLQAPPVSRTETRCRTTPPLYGFKGMDAGLNNTAAKPPEADANTDSALDGHEKSSTMLLQRAFEKALVSAATQVITDCQSDMDDGMSELDDG